jgi:putative Holliday junction resolvase
MSLSPFCLFWLQMVLERYFSMAGLGTELVLPKNLDLQEKLKTGPPKDVDFFPENLQ